MIKWFKSLFNICDHEWVHGGNVIMKNGKMGHLQLCSKCHLLRLNKSVYRADGV